MTNLGKHGVSGKFGKLGGPKSNGQDSLLGDPVGVDISQSLASPQSTLGLQRSDEDSVGSEEIGDGGSLGQELGVGKDVKVDSGLGVGVKDGPHRLGGSARNGGLLNDNLVGGGNSGDLSGSKLDVARGATRDDEKTELVELEIKHQYSLKIGSESLSDSGLLGGGLRWRANGKKVKALNLVG